MPIAKRGAARDRGGMAHPLSISAAATWTGGFLRREWPLLAPVAFAFLALPGLAAGLLVPRFGVMTQSAAMPGAMAFAPWMLWLVPIFALAMLGALALTALAVRPRITVGEALSVAGRRLPVLLGAMALVAAASFLALFLLVFVGALMRLPAGMLNGLGVALMVALTTLSAARLLPLLPVVVAEPVGPAEAIRRSLALTRGRFIALLGIFVLIFAAGQLVLLAARLGFGVVALLIGRQLGAEPLALLFAALAMASLSAAIGAANFTLIAGLYRQLAAR